MSGQPSEESSTAAFRTRSFECDMSACDRSLVSKAFGLGVTQFTDRYSPIPKRFALRLSGHVDAGTAAMVFVDGTGKLGTTTVAANGNKMPVASRHVQLNDFLDPHKTCD